MTIEELTAEMLDLEARKNKLMGDKEFGDLDHSLYELMNVQEKIMLAYLEVLMARLGIMKGRAA